jgi:hypothetical protein
LQPTACKAIVEQVEDEGSLALVVTAGESDGLVDHEIGDRDWRLHHLISQGHDFVEDPSILVPTNLAVDLDSLFPDQPTCFLARDQPSPR